MTITSTPSTPPPGSAGEGGSTPASLPDFSVLVSSLPQELRESGAIKDIKSFEDLVKRTVHATSMVGADKLVIPTDKSKPEEWDAFWGKLGRPGKAEEYELPKEGLPEGFSMQDGVKAELFKKAHSLGISKKQLAELVRFTAESESVQNRAEVEEYQRKIAKGQETLRQKLGSSYDQGMALAEQFIKKFGGPELWETMKQSSDMAADPNFVMMLVNAGKAMASDSILGGGSSTRLMKTPEESRNEIAQLQADPEFMKQYLNRYVSGHDQAVERMRKLFESAYPANAKPPAVEDGMGFRPGGGMAASVHHGVL